MQCPKAVIFDLDETLAASFQPPRPEMLTRLNTLQARLPVAIMSGAGFDRINRDVIEHLPTISPHFVLFPNSSSQCFMYKDGAWENVYNHVLSEVERTKIKDVLRAAITEIDDLRDAPQFGERIVDREAQIAFTAVGLDAPQDVKMSWDPTAQKRLRIAGILRDRLPEFDILIGGASTVDVTRKDTNKSHGVLWYAQYLNTTPGELLYVGDALYEGGNDAVVIPTGVLTRAVKNPAETERVIDELLAACSS